MKVKMKMKMKTKTKSFKLSMDLWMVKLLEEAKRPQRALAGLSKDKNLPKGHIISLVSLPLLTITYHGE